MKSRSKCLSATACLMMALVLFSPGILSAEDVAAATAPPEKFENDLGMVFVYIPPGDFIMGSPADEFMRSEDETRHKVVLTKGFYLQTTEVTQRQWKRVMGDNPSKFNWCGNCPVENVSWKNTQAFIERLNQLDKKDHYRLPTESEWEYACRAGTQTPFYFGAELSTDQANYDGYHPLPGSKRGINRKTTVKVGSFQANAWGLYDMHGNVYEWCQDWYGKYPVGVVTDPPGPASGDAKVCRGGGLSSYARRCRSANRTKHLPYYHEFYIGFRLVRNAP